jgi:uncharacterized protein (DUF433 family)
MRITVSVILKMLASVASVREGIDAYPELGVEDVQQALSPWAIDAGG